MSSLTPMQPLYVPEEVQLWPHGVGLRVDVKNLQQDGGPGERLYFPCHPRDVTACWNIFLSAFLGTEDKAVIGEYTRRLMSFYALKLYSDL